MRIRPRAVLAITIVAVISAAVIAVCNQPALLQVGALISLFAEESPPKLPIPVQQVASKDLEDTWGAPRSRNRRHEGIDIFAPLGRPVLSTTNGIVFKVGDDVLGGHVVRVLGPGWQWHYYAHLDRFGDIRPGNTVQPGTVLGYVGNTGNASGTPYHLHYGVYRFLGGAQNPYPLLATQSTESNIKKPAPKSARKDHSTHHHSKKHTTARKPGSHKLKKY